MLLQTWWNQCSCAVLWVVHGRHENSFSRRIMCMYGTLLGCIEYNPEILVAISSTESGVLTPQKPSILESQSAPLLCYKLPVFRSRLWSTTIEIYFYSFSSILKSFRQFFNSFLAILFIFFYFWTILWNWQKNWKELKRIVRKNGKNRKELKRIVRKMERNEKNWKQWKEL